MKNKTIQVKWTRESNENQPGKKKKEISFKYLVTKHTHTHTHTHTCIFIFKLNKPTWKGYTLYNSIYMTFWKRQNYGDRKKITGCTKWSMEDFFGQLNYSVWCQNGQHEACLSKLTDCTRPRAVNYSKLWTCQDRSTDHTTLVWDADNGWGYCVFGGWGNSVLSAQFCCEPNWY